MWHSGRSCLLFGGRTLHTLIVRHHGKSKLEAGEGEVNASPYPWERLAWSMAIYYGYYGILRNRNKKNITEYYGMFTPPLYKRLLRVSEVRNGELAVPTSRNGENQYFKIFLKGSLNWHALRPFKLVSVMGRIEWGHSQGDLFFLPFLSYAKATSF